MAALGQYVLRLIIGAFVCGVLLSMVHNAPGAGLLRFLCGVFLTMTLFAPLTKGQYLPKMDFLGEAMEDGEAQAEAGNEMAMEEIRRRISDELEAYILDKAGQWDTELDVTVILNEDCLPVGAEITGNLTDSRKEALSHILTEELGIPKENQLWIGQQDQKRYGRASGNTGM